MSFTPGVIGKISMAYMHTRALYAPYAPYSAATSVTTHGHIYIAQLTTDHRVLSALRQDMFISI